MNHKEQKALHNVGGTKGTKEKRPIDGRVWYRSKVNVGIDKIKALGKKGAE